LVIQQCSMSYVANDYELQILVLCLLGFILDNVELTSIKQKWKGVLQWITLNFQSICCFEHQ